MSSTNAATPFRRIVRIVAVAAWCTVIYTASDRPNLRVSDDDVLDLVLRKLAHLFEYALLAVLVARAAKHTTPWAVRTTVLAWLATLAWAISDEWHQTFVPGRVGHAQDVLIDMAGATLGLAVARSWQRRRAQRPIGTT